MSLKVSHLYKSYDKPIIQDFSYTFEDNHIYAITGPSGCGKTTLFKSYTNILLVSYSRIMH